MSNSTISAKVNTQILTKFDKLAKATNRSKSFLAAEAIEERIKEADKNNFVTDKDIKMFMKIGT